MSESEKDITTQSTADESATGQEATDDLSTESAHSRRRFTRQALAGSAVVFSLANRSAWSQSGGGDNCISKAFFDSFTDPGYVESIHPQNQDERLLMQEKAREIQELTAPGGGYELVETDNGLYCAVETGTTSTSVAADSSASGWTPPGWSKRPDKPNKPDKKK